MFKNIFLPFLMLLPLSVFSQHGEAGLILGASVYQGDLSPSNIWSNINETHVSVGGFYRHNFGDFVAVKLGLTYGSISGSDANSTADWRLERNLSFRSSVTELAITGEFNILGYQPYNLSRIFSPYIFGGIAAFHFNPRAKYDGNWVALQPLGTEGQGLPQYPEKVFYKQIQFSIPMGIGAKFALNDAWNIGVEMGSRMTFTDYLDDVSGTYAADAVLLESRGETAAALGNRTGLVKQGGEARGDPGDNDWYLMGGVTISYNFLDNGLAGFRNRNRSGKSGCPGF